METVIECGHELPLNASVTTSTGGLLGIGDTNTYCDVTATSAVVFLPECMAAAGKVYLIYLSATAGGHTLQIVPHYSIEVPISILDGGSVVPLATGFTLTAVEDYVQLYSTGYNWVVMSKKVTV